MPPKKKARLSSRPPSSASAETPKATTPKPQQGKDEDTPMEDAENDPWTDEQEIALFKGIIRYKPVGMHKHFRMIALSNHMRNSGFKEDHTRTPGIWQKLESLYNLKTLDEREDPLSGLVGEDGDATDLWFPFKLSGDGFEEMMHSRRIDEDNDSSPPSLHHQLSDGTDAGFGSTVEDSEGELDKSHLWSSANFPVDPRSSPSSIRGGRGGSRGGRGGNKRGRGRSRLQGESTPKGQAREESDSEEEGEEDEDEDEDEEEEESERSTPTTRGGRRGRGRGRTRTRGARGRRGK